MRICRVGLVDVASGRGHGAGLAALVYESVMVDDGCRLSMRPLAVCRDLGFEAGGASGDGSTADGAEGMGADRGRLFVVGLARTLPADGLGWERLRAKSFTLNVRRGRACFSRDLKLPEGVRGVGVGTYMLCSLVRRAVRLGFGGVKVRSLNLVKAQNTPLRNAFYERMGFDLTLYSDGSGWARARRLDQLRMRHDPAKVCGTAFDFPWFFRPGLCFSSLLPCPWPFPGVHPGLASNARKGAGLWK